MIRVIASILLAGIAAALTGYTWARRSGHLLRVREDQLPFIDDVLADIEHLPVTQDPGWWCREDHSIGRMQSAKVHWHPGRRHH